MREGWNFPLLKEIAEECRGSAALNHAHTYELWSVPSFSVGYPEIAKGSSILSAKRPVQTGDVLLCKINPRINRVWVVGDNEALPKVASTEWIVLRPKSKNLVSPRWLQLYLSSSAFRSWIVGEISGATGSHTRAKPREVMCRRIPLPPLPEQKRIVAILDEAFAGIATAVANTEKNLANARELFESYLSAVFSQRGVGWADYRLGDIVTRLTNGYVGPTRGIYQTTGVPYLLARHVKNNRLNFDGKTFITREFNAKNKKSILKYEDVLLVQSGHIGHSAVVTQEHEGHNCHAMIVLTPVNDIVTGPYLSLFFNSPLMQEEFQRIRSGSTVPHLTCREVKELVVTAPKLGEQRSIVERSQEIESRVLELVSIGQQKLNALTELKQCLLQKAFSGELTAVPQDEIETALA
jgi:type I restriction enzyme, S subunit